MADAIGKLTADDATLAEMSRRARSFAAEHSFEKEFARRTNAINAVLEG